VAARRWHFVGVTPDAAVLGKPPRTALAACRRRPQTTAPAQSPGGLHAGAAAGCIGD